MATFIYCSLIIGVCYLVLVSIIVNSGKEEFNYRHRGEIQCDKFSSRGKFYTIIKLLPFAFCPVFNLIIFLITILTFNYQVESIISQLEKQWEKDRSEIK